MPSFGSTSTSVLIRLLAPYATAVLVLGQQSNPRHQGNPRHQSNPTSAPTQRASADAGPVYVKAVAALRDALGVEDGCLVTPEEQLADDEDSELPPVTDAAWVQLVARCEPALALLEQGARLSRCTFPLAKPNFAITVFDRQLVEWNTLVEVMSVRMQQHARGGRVESALRDFETLLAVSRHHFLQIPTIFAGLGCSFEQRACEALTAAALPREVMRGRPLMAILDRHLERRPTIARTLVPSLTEVEHHIRQAEEEVVSRLGDDEESATARAEIRAGARSLTALWAGPITKAEELPRAELDAALRATGERAREILDNMTRLGLSARKLDRDALIAAGADRPLFTLGQLVAAMVTPNIEGMVAAMDRSRMAVVELQRAGK